MFTGIVESTGRVQAMESTGSNTSFWIESPISAELKVDQSVAHSGVCLTVEAVEEHRHRVTAILETLQKTNLGSWTEGTLVNLERCLPLHGRLDGHMVQGHVDTTGVCTGKFDKNGSWEFTFKFPDQFAALVIEKGSISLNGTSLTIFNVGRNCFTVAIIPYTLEHTNIQHVEVGSIVNLEFDMIGKYVSRITQLADEQEMHIVR
jgi:riboflavin synthase